MPVAHVIRAELACSGSRFLDGDFLSPPAEGRRELVQFDEDLLFSLSHAVPAGQAFLVLEEDRAD